MAEWEKTQAALPSGILLLPMAQVPHAYVLACCSVPSLFFFSFFRHWEILVVELAHHGAIGIERRARVRISNVGDPAHRQLKPPAGHQSDAGKNNETALNSESVSVGRLHTTVSVSRLV